MPGLNLGLSAGAQVGTPQGGTSAPATAGQAAFGSGFTSAAMPSSSSALTPNDPFGVALWVGIGAVALLVFIRYSLPA